MKFEGTCQDDSLRVASHHRLPLLVYLDRFLWRLKHEGPLQTAKRIFRRLQYGARRFMGSGTETEAPTPQIKCEPLNLQAGELVQVKAPEEIRRTLDRTGKVKGLAFMPAMYQYCGKQFRVLKPVRRIIQENVSGSERVRSMTGTVLLEGVICDGSSLSCDRSCYYFWRECWLLRVKTADGTTRNAAPQSDPSGQP